MSDDPPERSGSPTVIVTAAQRSLTRAGVVGHQIAVEAMLQRTMQTVLGFVRPEARPELLRAMRKAVEQSVASVELGDPAATEDARRSARVAVAFVFGPLEEEFALREPGPKRPAN